MKPHRPGRNRTWVGLLCLPLPFMLVAVSCQKKDQVDGAAKIDLRILCTRSPKEGRTDDFVAFLSKHFAKVATTDYLTFREEQAKGFDVVIIDYGTTRPGSPLPSIAPGYARATVTMGVAGSEVCRRLSLKPGYL